MVMLSEVSQRREGQISHDIAYVWNLKIMVQMNDLQNRNRNHDIENSLMVSREKEGGIN